MWACGKVYIYLALARLVTGREMVRSDERCLAPGVLEEDSLPVPQPLPDRKPRTQRFTLEMVYTETGDAILLVWRISEQVSLLPP